METSFLNLCSVGCIHVVVSNSRVYWAHFECHNSSNKLFFWAFPFMVFVHILLVLTVIFYPHGNSWLFIYLALHVFENWCPNILPSQSLTWFSRPSFICSLWSWGQAPRLGMWTTIFMSNAKEGWEGWEVVRLPFLNWAFLGQCNLNYFLEFPQVDSDIFFSLCIFCERIGLWSYVIFPLDNVAVWF